MKRPLLLALTLSLALLSSVRAQSTSGHLQGTILDEQGAPLPGANIEVTGPDIMATRGASARDDGGFRVLALPVGEVQVRITFVGFEPVELTGIRIRLGETTTIGEVRLQPEAVVMDALLVLADRSAIDVTTTSIGTGMTVETMTDLPVGRDMSSVVAMLPQAIESYTGNGIQVAGSTGSENAFYMNGVNTTSGYDGSVIAELPYNFVREIQIKTGGYEAEYGRALGGIVSVLTKSGSNTHKASAFGFLTNNALSGDARRSFTEQIKTDGFLRYDAGFGVGGPLLRDRLWYYVAYNRKVESTDLLFDAVGLRSEERVTNIYSAKLSWKATERTRVELSAFGNPMTGDRIGGWMFWSVPTHVVNEETMLGEVTKGTHTLALEVNHVASENFLLEGKASWFDSHDNVDPGTEMGAAEPFRSVDSTNTWSGGFPGYGRLDMHRGSLGLTGTWFVGAHSFKAGVEYEENYSAGQRIMRSENGPDVATILDGRTDPNGGPPGAGAISRTGPDSWIVWFMSDGSSNYGKNATAFAQARLQLSDRLTGTFGLRWDTQAFRSADFDYKYTLPWMWQPRLGLVYEPGARGTQKAFVHAGRFYEQVPLALSNTYMVPPLCWLAVFNHDPEVDATGASMVQCTEKAPMEYLVADEVRGQYYDAVTAGYQRVVGGLHRIGLTGTHRAIGEVLNVGINPDLPDFVMGNPGSGALDFLPEAVRHYTAMEITLDRIVPGNLRYSLSYVLSRTWGNYPGVASDGDFFPNGAVSFGTAETIETGGKGLLPTDRTHVLKFNGSYTTEFGLTAGTFFAWQSGTPMSELTYHPFLGFYSSFATTRGTLGRTPAIFDMSFRFSYDLNRLTRQSFRQKIILDVLHVFSARKGLRFEQQRYFMNFEGSAYENPNYLEPVAFFPPMTIRLGVELEF